MTDLRGRREPGWTPDASEFGTRLAMVRQRMGWGNVKQAAELCGVPVQSWRGWERDGFAPRNLVNVCMKIAGVTNVNLDWLLRGPIDSTAATAEQAAGTTLWYSAHGERIVAVGMDDRRIDRSRTRPIVRQRPIDQGRSSHLVAV